MKHIAALFGMTALLSVCLKAQSAGCPYREEKYGWRVEKDLLYGRDVNYLGDSLDLRLDLYKPIGDNNPARPLIVYVHGGFMLTGCKEGPAWFAQAMAARGYVVACVDYRKGWHKTDHVSAPNCLLNLLNFDVKCLYAADTAEHYRAIYRGMQDVKGAIRWLKARASADSVDIENVVVGGESAGAFISFAVALLDRPEEKPASCYAIPAAPKPYAAGVNCFETELCKRQFRTPSGTQLLRPDLGPVEGRLHLNGHHTRVRAVISFYGGVPVEAHPQAKDWFRGPDTPAFYLYHQTCDVVVPFRYGRPLEILSVYCNTGCTPWHHGYMHLYGNGAIADFIESLPKRPPLAKDFPYCKPFDPDITLLECIRMLDNGGYHRILDHKGSAQKIADFLCPTLVTAPNVRPGVGVSLWPNPFQQRLFLRIHAPDPGPATLWLTDLSGRAVWTAERYLQSGEQLLMEHHSLASGIYLLHIRTGGWTAVYKLIKQ